MNKKNIPADDEGLKPLPPVENMNSWIEIQKSLARGVARYGKMTRAPEDQTEELTVLYFACIRSGLRPELVPLWDNALEVNASTWARDILGGEG